MEGDLDMNYIHRINNLRDPLYPQDAVTLSYVEQIKPVITIWAQSDGPLNAGQY